jgi:hypothetical protein
MILGAVVSLLVDAALGSPLQKSLDRLRRHFLKSAIYRHLSPSAARERRHRDFLTRDQEVDGVFTLLAWSPERPLRRDARFHRVEYGSPPEQDWFDPAALSAAQANQALTRQGNTAYAYAMTIDHREHENADSFVLHVAPSNYGDLNAIADCVGGDIAAFVRTRLHERGATQFLRTMPPTRLSIQVAVVSPMGNVLALRRSSAVGSAPGMWSLGPNETLVASPARSTPGTPSESLFDLAERCLAEECGLRADVEPPDVGPIHITWFGISTHQLEGVAQNALAVTTCRLPESEIVERVKNAHSNFEADGIDWLPLDLDSLSETLDARRREWIRFSPLAAVEVWRYRNLIYSDLAAFRLGRA